MKIGKYCLVAALFVIFSTGCSKKGEPVADEKAGEVPVVADKGNEAVNVAGEAKPEAKAEEVKKADDNVAPVAKPNEEKKAEPEVKVEEVKEAEAESDDENPDQEPITPHNFLGVDPETCHVVHCDAGAVDCDTKKIVKAGYKYLDEVFTLEVIQRSGEDCVMELDESYCFLKKTEFDEFLKKEYSNFTFNEITCEDKSCVAEDTTMCTNH